MSLSVTGRSSVDWWQETRAFSVARSGLPFVQPFRYLSHSCGSNCIALCHYHAASLHRQCNRSQVSAAACCLLGQVLVYLHFHPQNWCRQANDAIDNVVRTVSSKSVRAVENDIAKWLDHSRCHSPVLISPTGVHSDMLPLHRAYTFLLMVTFGEPMERAR